MFSCKRDTIRHLCGAPAGLTLVFILLYILVQLFPANKDRNTVVKKYFKRPFLARFVKLHPYSWHGHISIRVELYGSLIDKFQFVCLMHQIFTSFEHRKICLSIADSPLDSKINFHCVHSRLNLFFQSLYFPYIFVISGICSRLTVAVVNFCDNFNLSRFAQNNFGSCQVRIVKKLDRLRARC